MMRNSKHFVLGAATLLLSTAGFTACSSEDTFTGGSFSGESVKTQFAINVPAVGKSDARMGEDIVQGQNTVVFRGMSNIRLVPFKLGSDPSSVTEPLTGSESLYYNAIELGAIGSSDLTSTAKYKVYNDVELPIGVNAFLFYGEATDKSDDASDKTNGALVPSYSTQGLEAGKTLADVHFDLKGILVGDDYKTTQTGLLAILDGIAKTEGWKDATGTLQPYYTSFIGMKAGSANNILLAVQDLYNAVKGDVLTDESGLKAKIATKIEEYFTPSGSSVPYTLTYNTTSLAQYPFGIGLPDGAVQVAWNTDRFEYTSNVDYDGGTTMNVSGLDKYVYPASLYYWDNTSLKTSTDLESGNYGVKDWSSIITDLYTEGWAVTASTQSVALAKAINYAVGRLDVYAAFAAGEIYDANPSGQQPVRIPDDGFTLTGVLIGGQKNVGWNFAPLESDGTEKTIYDAAVDAGAAGTEGVTRTSGLKNRTLVLETAGNAGEKVNFALEFTNNSSQAFYGKDGLVPVGGKFYLVGQLSADGSHAKVFEKDHYTKATVTINSLKNAYNCIPDLRSPKLELGLSVDLKWEEGLSQNVTIQ
ncbi:putative uncharacterized protein [Prevotella sp. CAG:617]|nr:putative uncharacterized protein [Prevotella sp. CAG:617]